MDYLTIDLDYIFVIDLLYVVFDTLCISLLRISKYSDFTTGVRFMTRSEFFSSPL